jgi:hypothetical protein
MTLGHRLPAVRYNSTGKPLPSVSGLQQAAWVLLLPVEGTATTNGVQTALSLTPMSTAMDMLMRRLSISARSSAM